MKYKLTLLVVLISALMLSSSIMTVTFAQMPTQMPSDENQTCEQCGMNVAADSQAYLKVVDKNGTNHYTECIMCALKLLNNTNYDQLNITTYCDWYGPNYTITIVAKQHGNIVTTNPPNALDNARIVGGGGCTKNRVAYNQTAVDSLIANGYSNYTTMMLRTALPANATIMTITQAALKYGAGITSPTPSPSPSPTLSHSPEPTETPSVSPTPTSSPSASPTASPTPTPSPSSHPVTSSSPTPKLTQPQTTASPEIIPTESPAPTTSPSMIVTASPFATNAPTQTCEICTMDVNADAQAKYRIVDGNGTVHYAECFMCALNLLNKYNQVDIATTCDWYGPNYTITVHSTNYGSQITVTPSTAMFLNGGSCVINRAAYNQTAADALIANGFSQYTLKEQQYPLPTGTNVTTIKDAAMKFTQTTQPPNSMPTAIIVLAAIVGVIVIVGAIVAYKKLKRP